MRSGGASIKVFIYKICKKTGLEKDAKIEKGTQLKPVNTLHFAKFSHK